MPGMLTVDQASDEEDFPILRAHLDADARGGQQATHEDGPLPPDSVHDQPRDEDADSVAAGPHAGPCGLDLCLIVSIRSGREGSCVGGREGGREGRRKERLDNQFRREGAKEYGRSNNNNARTGELTINCAYVLCHCFLSGCAQTIACDDPSWSESKESACFFSCGWVAWIDRQSRPAIHEM